MRRWRQLFNHADFLVAALPFAQENSSNLLDTHVPGEHDDVEFSPFVARIPLHRPSAVL